MAQTIKAKEKAPERVNILNYQAKASLATAFLAFMGATSAVTDAGTGITMQSLLGTNFIAEGFIALALTVAVCIGISRDLRRAATLLLPVNWLVSAIGFPTGIFMWALIPISGVALFKDSIVTNKITQIGGWTAEQTGAVISGAATGAARTAGYIGEGEKLTAFNLGKGQESFERRMERKAFDMASATADSATERGKYARMLKSGFSVDAVKTERMRDTLNKAHAGAGHLAEEKRQVQEAYRNLRGRQIHPKFGFGADFGAGKNSGGGGPIPPQPPSGGKTQSKPGANKFSVGRAMNDLRKRASEYKEGSKEWETIKRGFRYNVEWMKKQGKFKPYKGPLKGK